MKLVLLIRLSLFGKNIFQGDIGKSSSFPEMNTGGTKIPGLRDLLVV